MSAQHYCLRWNNYRSNLTRVFDLLLQNELFVDVTLAATDLAIKAHRVILSACSPYFKSILSENPCDHPIVILRDVEGGDLASLVQFMYRGEVSVSHEQLPRLLRVADMLKIRGLAEVGDDDEEEENAVRAARASDEASPVVVAGGDSVDPTSRAAAPDNTVSGEPIVLSTALHEVPRESGDVSPAAGAVRLSPESVSCPTAEVEVSRVPLGEARPLATSSSSSKCSAREDVEIRPAIAEMIKEEQRTKMLESVATWNRSPETTFQHQLQQAWQKSWNQQQGIMQNVRFRERGPLKTWRPETMADAILCVLREGHSLSQAARKFDIPYPTFVLYANRVHNLLGPSLEAGVGDLRPKGRGRPQRILLGNWPDETIKNVIRAVVFRDTSGLRLHMQNKASAAAMAMHAAVARQMPGYPSAALSAPHITHTSASGLTSAGSASSLARALHVHQRPSVPLLDVLRPMRVPAGGVPAPSSATYMPPGGQQRLMELSEMHMMMGLMAAGAGASSSSSPSVNAAAMMNTSSDSVPKIKLPPFPRARVDSAAVNGSLLVDPAVHESDASANSPHKSANFTVDLTSSGAADKQSSPVITLDGADDSSLAQSSNRAHSDHISAASLQNSSDITCFALPGHLQLSSADGADGRSEEYARAVATNYLLNAANPTRSLSLEAFTTKQSGSAAEPVSRCAEFVSSASENVASGGHITTVDTNMTHVRDLSVAQDAEVSAARFTPELSQLPAAMLPSMASMTSAHLPTLQASP